VTQERVGVNRPLPAIVVPGEEPHRLRQLRRAPAETPATPLQLPQLGAHAARRAPASPYTAAPSVQYRPAAGSVSRATAMVR
jgi:hypothetical protein